MKVDSILEAIFSHAVALTQSGRLKNEIYLSGRVVYVVNFDDTVILRFELPAGSASYPGEINFNSSDFDSNDFYEQDGKIVFRQKAAGFVREKICGSIGKSFEDIDILFNKYIDGFEKTHQNIFHIHSGILSLLEEGLSHIEIFAENKKPVLIQRDIYSGTIVKLTKDDSRGLGITSDSIKEDFVPSALRTGDFFAVFTFNDNVKFYFKNSGGFTFITGSKFNMTGVISFCLYDEMGGEASDKTKVLEEKKKGESHGREEQEDRGSEQTTGATAHKRTRKTEVGQAVALRGRRRGAGPV